MLVHTSRCAGVYLRIADFMVMFSQRLVELRLIVHGRLGCRDIPGVVVLDLGLVPNEAGRRSFWRCVFARFQLLGDAARVLTMCVISFG